MAKFKVSFYKYKSASDGFRVQTNTVESTRFMTKKELIDTADLRHSVLNQRECFECKSSSRNGLLKKFFLHSPLHYLKIERV